MSDNIHYSRWGKATWENDRDTDAPSGGQVAGGGGPPHNTDMEPRVAALEADMKDVKASLHRLELSSQRIEQSLIAIRVDVLPTLSTKLDIANTNKDIQLVQESLRGVDKRVALVESGSQTIANAAIGKNIGPWQMPAIIGASIVVGGAALAGAGYLLRLAGMLPH